MDRRFSRAWSTAVTISSNSLQSLSYGSCSRMCASRRILMSNIADRPGLRRGLEVVVLAAPGGQPIPGSAILGSPSPAPPAPNSNRQGNTSAFETLDPTVVIILVVLLFALICAAFLNSVMRCVLRRARGQRVQAAAAAAAAGHGGRGDQSSLQGLDSKTLASLPVLTFKADKLGKESALADCTICLSEFTENEKLRLLPKCSHVFHLDCIDMWLRSHVTCPVCRDGVGDDDDGHSINMVRMNDDRIAAGAAAPEGPLILIHDQHGNPSVTTAAAGHEGPMILIHDQHQGQPSSVSSAAAAMICGPPNLRAELLGDINERSPSDAMIVRQPLSNQEATGSRRSLRLTLSSMFAADNFLSGRWQASSSSSAAAPTAAAARAATPTSSAR